jgi:hypothetical protein
MVNISEDDRSTERRIQDNEIAAEPKLLPIDLPVHASATPIETHLHQLSHPMAVAGVIENGLVRVLDPFVNLPEHSRVIIVATEHH